MDVPFDIQKMGRIMLKMALSPLFFVSFTKKTKQKKNVSKFLFHSSFFRQPNTGLTALCSYYVLTIKFDFVLYSFFANILELVMVEGLLLIKLETLCSHSIQSNFLKNKTAILLQKTSPLLVGIKMDEKWHNSATCEYFRYEIPKFP